MLGYRANTEENGRAKAISSFMKLDLLSLTPFGFHKINDETIDVLESMKKLIASNR